MHGDLGDLSKTRLKGLVLPFRNTTINVQLWHFLQRLTDNELMSSQRPRSEVNRYFASIPQSYVSWLKSNKRDKMLDPKINLETYVEQIAGNY